MGAERWGVRGGKRLGLPRQSDVDGAAHEVGEPEPCGFQGRADIDERLCDLLVEGLRQPAVLRKLTAHPREIERVPRPDAGRVWTERRREGSPGRLHDACSRQITKPDAADLNARAVGQPLRLDGCSRRDPVTEHAAVHLVHPRVVVHGREVNVALDQVAEAHSGALQHRPDVVHRLLSLCRDALRLAAGDPITPRLR